MKARKKVQVKTRIYKRGGRWFAQIEQPWGVTQLGPGRESPLLAYEALRCRLETTARLFVPEIKKQESGW